MRNNLSAQSVLHAISRRGLMLAAVLVMSLEAVGPTATRAAPASARRSYRMTVSPYYLKLCVGQTANVTVSVDLLTSRGRGRPPGQQRVRGHWVSLHGVSGNSSIRVLPVGGYLNGSRPKMTFAVTGARRGNFTIRFTQSQFDPNDTSGLAPLIVGGASGPLAAPAAVAELHGRVEDSCSFDLFVISSGTRPKGFVERMTSALTATITPDPTTGKFSQEVDVVNRITQTRRIPCASSVRASASDATVEGKLDPQTGVLDITVSYGDIEGVETTVSCPYVGRGGSTGTAKWKAFEPQPVRLRIPDALTAIASWTASGTFQHIGYTDVRIVGRGIYTIIPH